MADRIKLKKVPVDGKINAGISVLSRNTYMKDPVISNENKLFEKITSEIGPRKSIIEFQNNWHSRMLKKQLTARPIKVIGGEIKISDVSLETQYETINDSQYALTPRYCRDNSKTYGTNIKCKMTFYQEGKNDKRVSINNIDLGQIPIMVYSSECFLADKNEAQKLSFGECTNDGGVYFITEGLEKTIVTQENLRIALFMMWINDSTSKVESRITCQMDYGTIIVKMVIGSKWDTLKVNIRYLFDGHIPLFVAFAFLGYNESNAVDLINHFVHQKYRLAIIMYLQCSIMKSRSIGNRIVEYIIKKKGKQKNTPKGSEENEAVVKSIVIDNLFPHISNVHSKAKALAYMAVQMIMNIIGERAIDDRDSWSFKKVSPPGKIMEIKLNTILTQHTSGYNKKAQKTQSSQNSPNAIINSLASQIGNDITTTFRHSFLNVWTVKNGQIIESVTDLLKRDTPAAMISQITKLSVPTSRKGKNPAIRELQQSQLGFVCPAETPEGSSCGIVKNFASTCTISLDVDPDDFFNVMKGGKIKISKDEEEKFDWKDIVYILPSEDPTLVGAEIDTLNDYDSYLDVDVEKGDDEVDHDYNVRVHMIKEEEIIKKYPYPLFVNGKIVGWCSGKQLADSLTICKKFGTVPRDSCIFWNDVRESVEVDTTGGRCMRSLLIVEDNKLLIDEGGWDLEVNELLSNGMMILVDSREQEKIMLAQQVSDVRNYEAKMKDLEQKIEEAKGNISSPDDGSLPKDEARIKYYTTELKEMMENRYTHCEIHPIAQYGNLASMIPEANKTQGPRITYQSGMSRQALNQYNTLHHEKFESTIKIMKSPTLPLFRSETNKFNGLSVMPAGDTIIKAIYAHPDNPEDGIVINENSIKAGKFKIVKYITIKIVLKPIESLGLLPKFAVDPLYHAIQENGLPRLDSYIRKDDCILAKFKKNGDDGEKNASIMTSVGEEGYVSHILTTSSSKNKTNKIIRIKLKQVRNIMEGDKFASRYAQKGTVSKIIPQELLPRIMSGPNKGLVPDLFVNPHSIPSRMPMGEQDEMITSKAALYNGNIVDATTFNNLDINKSIATLKSVWSKHVVNYPEDEDHGKLFHLGYEDMELPIRVIPEDKRHLREGPRNLVASGRYRPCRKPIYVGPCYTQALRHHVLDKFQIRSIGAVEPKTYQPIKGRSRMGGLRFGEMERDALLSHGATAILLERMMKVSDEFETVICVTCGNFVVANFKDNFISCGVCKTSIDSGDEEKKGEFGLITIPYVFKYLINLLMLSMISVTFKVVKSSTFGTGKNIMEDEYVT